MAPVVSRVNGCAATSATLVETSAAVVGSSRAKNAASTDSGAASGARIHAVRSDTAMVARPAIAPRTSPSTVGRRAARAEAGAAPERVGVVIGRPRGLVQRPDGAVPVTLDRSSQLSP